MKLALRWIPTEVWMDVFRYPWISRRKLGRIVHRFRNRKFADFLQFYLHDWGKRTLGRIHLYENETIPRAPLPDNIKLFKCITISHFDSQTLDFLHRINKLFTGVNLDFLGLSDLANLRTVFDHLCPLLHGIHSLAFDNGAIPLVEHYFGPKLAQIKKLAINFLPDEQFDPTTIQAAINFSLNWLTMEGRDTTDEPKFLDIHTDWAIFHQLSMTIKEQFLSAKRPCTFAVRRCCDVDEEDIDPNFNLDLENSIGERLQGEFYPVGHCVHFRIFRHQPNAGTALQEWVEETEGKYRTNNIDISEYIAIGPIDANAGDNGVDEAAGAEEDGPSTSKKPKLTQ